MNFTHLTLMAFSLLLVQLGSASAAKDEKTVNLGAPRKPKQPEERRYHLKWLHAGTEYPFSFEKVIGDDGESYEWHKLDENVDVAHSRDFSSSLFMYRDAHKTYLFVDKYNALTHSALTTYEPRRIDFPRALVRQRDLFTLVYLTSHRIRVERFVDHINVTCIGDFLVDKASMDTNYRLVDQMKQLAIFKLNLKEPESRGSQNYFAADESGYASYKQKTSKGHHSSSYSRVQMLRKKRDAADTKPVFEDNVDESDLEEDKEFVTVRLSLGPVSLRKPFDEGLISCSLDLVNADDVNYDYHEKMYRFLTVDDRGFDGIDEEEVEKVSVQAPAKESLETSERRLAVNSAAEAGQTVLVVNETVQEASKLTFLIDKADESRPRKENKSAHFLDFVIDAKKVDGEKIVTDSKTKFLFFVDSPARPDNMNEPQVYEERLLASGANRAASSSLWLGTVVIFLSALFY